MDISDRVPVTLPATKKSRKTKKGAKAKRAKGKSKKSIFARARPMVTAAALGTGLAIGAAVGAVVGRRR